MQRKSSAATWPRRFIPMVVVVVAAASALASRSVILTAVFLRRCTFGFAWRHFFFFFFFLPTFPFLAMIIHQGPNTEELVCVCVWCLRRGRCSYEMQTDEANNHKPVCMCIYETRTKKEKKAKNKKKQESKELE